jgi:putative aldouronate transport system substrate-binding protein
MSTIKKWGKKVLAIALVLVMVLSVVGCSSKKETTESSTTTTDNSSSDTAKDTSSDTKNDTAGNDTAKSEEMVTIKVFRDLFKLGAPDQDQIKKVQDAINAYIADKINVQIEITEVVNGEYPEKANLALAGGEVNLLWTAAWQSVVGCDDVQKQNAVIDITDWIQKYEFYSLLPEWIWDATAYSGRNYFIPVYKDLAEGYDLMFRKELVDKYGWDLSKVKTLKDIEPMLEQIKADGIKYPYISQRHHMFYRYYLDKFDFITQDSFIGIDRATDEVVNTVLTPEYAEFATLMGDWAVKGYLSEDEITKTLPETITKTQDYGISWWTDVPNNKEADSRYFQPIEVIKFTNNWVASNTTLGSCYCISSTSTDAEIDACLKFLDLLYTDTTVADLFTFGIEGEDYDRVDGRVVQRADAKYSHDMWESTAPFALSLLEGEPENKVDLYKAFNDSAKVSSACGFRFKTAEVDAEYTACQQVFEELGRTLELGGYAPADVPAAIEAYQKALDEAGYQKVFAEAQRQYAEWKSSN